MDLMEFAVFSIRSKIRFLLKAKDEPLLLKELEPPLSLSAPASVGSEINLKSPEEPTVFLSSASHVNFVGEVGTTLFVHPAITFDSVLSVIPYGDKVFVHELQGRFASVSWHGLNGWVLKDVLYDDKNDVMPTFTAGMVYTADKPAVMKLRSFIGDEFSGKLASVPLTSVEYAYYKLMTKERVLDWGRTRPREAGMWQSILKGRPGIHIGLIPKTGTVMEYLTPSGGQLAYVDRVSPNEEITISGVSEGVEAVYFEQTLKKVEWIELRPVFIAVV